MVDRGYGSQEQSNRRGNSETQRREASGVGEHLGDLVRDRLATPKRTSKVTPDCIQHEASELHVRRLVEAKLASDALVLLIRPIGQFCAAAGLGHHQHDWIAR